MKPGATGKPAPKPQAKSAAAKGFAKAATSQALPAKPAPKPEAKPGFFEVDPVGADFVTDGREARRQHTKLIRRIRIQSYVIGALCLLFVIGLPFFQPIYMYYALTPEKQGMMMVALTMPNMTNRAVLSWATNSITEIMTIGFGDFEQRLMAQRPRFTPEGWESFTNAFVRQKIGQSFRQNQLVLTTVPSDTPVIVAEGENPKHIYEWHVQMPVIMTYATNNNVTRREKAIIELTVTRVSPQDNPAGIGIAAWQLKQ